MFINFIRYRLASCLLLVSSACFASNDPCNADQTSGVPWYNFANDLVGVHAATIKLYFTNSNGCNQDGGGMNYLVTKFNSSSNAISIPPGKSLAQIAVNNLPNVDVVRGEFVNTINYKCTFTANITWEDPITKSTYSYKYPVSYSGQDSSGNKASYCILTASITGVGGGYSQ